MEVAEIHKGSGPLGLIWMGRGVAKHLLVRHHWIEVAPERHIIPMGHDPLHAWCIYPFREVAFAFSQGIMCLLSVFQSTPDRQGRRRNTQGVWPLGLIWMGWGVAN